MNTAYKHQRFFEPHSIGAILGALLFFGILTIGTCAKAQTVAISGTQRPLSVTNQAVTATSCTAAAGSRWAFWYPTSTQRTVAWDVTFVDADSSAASLDIRCETTSTAATAADAGQDLPVITATASTGISSMTQGTWRWVATGGGAPGSSTFVLQIANIPNAFIGCLFTCGAGAGAADTITAVVRGVNP